MHLFGGGCSSRSMPACANCEAFVTEQYVRVFAPPEMDTVRVCPNCEDMIREGAEIREARSSRG
jgi:RNA polymerase subunit RPABC4/transcription elongation factor Spt4